MERILSKTIVHPKGVPIVYLIPLFCRKLQAASAKEKGLSFQQFFDMECEKLELLPPAKVANICLEKFLRLAEVPLSKI